MKKSLLNFLLSFFFFLFSFSAFAQQAPTTLQGWADRLDKFGKGLPQEQVFIHMDNTCYFLGDTIYYKAYVRRSDTGAPSRVSGVLYAELLNQDGYLVQRQQLELKDGQSNGSFVLQDTLYGGYYELRAYTRWQLNWGITEHDHNLLSEQWFYSKRMAKDYYRDYEKLYSRVFPVFDKPKEPGDFYHEMTLRPLRRQSKIDETSPKPKLQLFPEGGNLVAGVPNRVAFEATSNEGLHLDGKVTVTEGQSNVVAEAEIEQRGRGSFTFTPQSGKGYLVTYTGKKGKVEEHLSSAEKNGCALQVTRENGQTQVQIAAAGTAASEELGMTVMHDGVMLDFQTIPAGATTTITLDEEKLKTGVCQVTIFNNAGRVYADRLFFCRKGDFTPSNLHFTGLSQQPAEPFAPVSLAVEGGKPGATVSVSVCDATHSEYLYDNGNILTEMLLASQIRGFVEDPGYFFEKDDEEHNRALDLLLMIQGWRRYDWHTMTTPGAFELNHKPEQTPLIIGEVNSYLAMEQESEFADNFSSLDAGTNATDEVSLYGNDKAITDADLNTTKQAEDGGSVTDARANKETTGRDVPVQADQLDRRGKEVGSITKEVLVNASFYKTGSDQQFSGQMMTQKHVFNIETPRFYEGCIFDLSASDSTKWKGKPHAWNIPATDSKDRLNYPEFYVRLRPYFPRFVKPYDWYQCHLAEAPKGSVIAPEWVMDGSRLLDEVTIGVKRARLRKFDPTKPAFVIDAYEAFNEACDAGFCPGVYYGSNRFARDISRAYIGDMNLSRDYDLVLRLDGKSQSNMSANTQSRTAIGGAAPDAMPVESFNISSYKKDMYNLLKNLGNVYIFTDYSPRREGNSLFSGEDIPNVEIDLRLIDNVGSTRRTSRDRRYKLPGFSAPEEFYQPDYSNKPLPEVKDYRRTLYWNPDLKLDDSGKAEFNFYGNGKQTHLTVRAEGIANDGTLLTGKSMPEDR